MVARTRSVKPEKAPSEEKVQTASRSLAASPIDALLRESLYPLAAPYFSYDGARVYFAQNFADDVAARAATIPEGALVAPRAYVAGPLLQGLSLAFDEPALRGLYLGLLTVAMDGRIADNCHPGFAEIARQLTPEETPLLGTLLRAGKMPIVEYTIATAGKPGYRPGLRHLIDYPRVENDPAKNRRLAGSVQNWARLGLAEIDYTQQMVKPSAYDWATRRPEYLVLLSRLADHQSVQVTTGVLHRTDFGRRFGEATGLVPSA